MLVGSDKLCRGPLRGQKPNKMRPIPGKEIPDKTSQDVPHPRKSRTKPDKMSPIPGNLGQNLRLAPSPQIPDKTSHDATHLRKYRKNPTKKRRFFLCCCLFGCSDNLCRGTLREQKSWTKPHMMRPIPWNSRTKLHKMSPITGNLGQNLTRCALSPEIPDKTSQDEPHPRKSRKKLHKKRFAFGCWLVVVVPTTSA